jgi:hypothetical protein
MLSYSCQQYGAGGWIIILFFLIILFTVGTIKFTLCVCVGIRSITLI